jgi:hypothetical protein
LRFSFLFYRKRRKGYFLGYFIWNVSDIYKNRRIDFQKNGLAATAKFSIEKKRADNLFTPPVGISKKLSRWILVFLPNNKRPEYRLSEINRNFYNKQGEKHGRSS